MRYALLVLVLVGCAKRNSGSLVLQGKVADQAGPGGSRGCPWTEIESVRTEPDTLWVNDTPWAMDTTEGANAFASMLALCGKTDAVGPLRDWRAAEQDARESRSDVGKQTAENIGTILIAGAASAAANAASGEPLDDQLSHAVRDQNLQPTASPATRPLDPALVEARQAVIDALMGSGEPDR